MGGVHRWEVYIGGRCAQVGGVHRWEWEVGGVHRWEVG